MFESRAPFGQFALARAYGPLCGSQKVTASSRNLNRASTQDNKTQETDTQRPTGDSGRRNPSLTFLRYLKKF